MTLSEWIQSNRGGTSFRSSIKPVAIAIAVLATLVIFIWNAQFGVIAPFLIDPDSPVKADFIYLLGGDCFLRAPLAAKLYKLGYAPKIVIAREPTFRYPDRVVSFTDMTIGVLAAQGVPRNKIVDFGPTTGVRSTADEGRVLRLYITEYPAANILVVTSILHSRRARMVMTRALRGKGVSVHIACVGEPKYTPSEEAPAKLEWIKLVYYFFTFPG